MYINKNPGSIKWLRGSAKKAGFDDPEKRVEAESKRISKESKATQAPQKRKSGDLAKASSSSKKPKSK